MNKIVQTVYHSTETLLKKPHFHDCHQIILINSGNVKFCVNNVYYNAKAGDVAIFSRYENHSVSVFSKEYDRYVLKIEPDVVLQKSPVYTLLTNRPIGFCNIINISTHIEDIVWIFKQLICEHKTEHRLSAEMEDVLIKQLLITIYRCTTLQLDNLHDDIVNEIKKQFDNNYREQYSLNLLSKQYSLSISSLSHRFRSVTGTSVMEYLQACRMVHAKNMLVDTDSSIGEIVEKCGFSDNSNFSRTFKKNNGMSPTDFRKKYKHI